MDHDPHTGFIVAAYAVAAAVIATMIVAVLLDHRSLKRQLRRFGDDGDRSASRENPPS